MKKNLLIVLLFLICSILPARSVNGLFSPYMSRVEGMGGASVASAKYSDVLYSNPALISADEQFLSIPSVSLTLFNFNKLVDPFGGSLYILLKEDHTQESYRRALSQFINTIGPGQGDLASADISLGMISGVMALGFDVALDLHTMGSGAEGSTVVLESNIVASLGLGIPFEYKGFGVSFGASVRFDYRTYTIDDMDQHNEGGFNASFLLDMFSDPEKVSPLLLNSTPVAAGFSIPFDLGMTISFPYGFKLGLVYKGLNSDLYMQSYNGINQLYNSLTGGNLGIEPDKLEKGPSFKLDGTSSLDAGFSWRYAEGFFAWVTPAIAFDVVDLINIGDDLSFSGFFYHVKLGAEIRLMNTLDLRCGLNQGYLSFGFGFDFQILRIDLTYATHEYGPSLGDKPQDSLSIRIKLGFED